MKNQVAAVEGITVDFARRYLNFILVAVIGDNVIAAVILISLFGGIARHSSVALAQIYRGGAEDSIIAVARFDENIFTLNGDGIVTCARLQVSHNRHSWK